MSMQTYEQWIDEVDEILTDRVMTISDFYPDFDFKGAYEFGTSPIQAAIEAVFNVSVDLGGVHE